MSENLEQAVQERVSPYEHVRDSLPLGEERGQPTIGVLWRHADRTRAQLRDTVASIREDPELTPEAKEKRIEQAYQRAAPLIKSQSEKARGMAKKKADEARGRAIPGAKDPRTENDPLVSSNVLLQASELTDRVRRIEEGTPKGMSSAPRVSELLRSEYAKATEAGGLGGATSCAAILRCAESVGLDPEDLYSSLRTEEHVAALNEVYDYERVLHTIPTDVPDVVGYKQSSNHWRSGRTPQLSVPKGGPLGGGAKRKKRLWK